jgi:hypothetical protein
VNRRGLPTLAFATLASFAGWMVIACSEQPIGAPVGDQNFDDPNDPGQVGNANFAPEAGDANGRFCVAARDCPAVFVCAYPIADVCGAVGHCMPYTPVAGCESNFACACDGTDITLCAPAGFATQPVATLGACDGGSVPDATVNDASDDAAVVDDGSADADDATPE